MFHSYFKLAITSPFWTLCYINFTFQIYSLRRQHSKIVRWMCIWESSDKKAYNEPYRAKKEKRNQIALTLGIDDKQRSPLLKLKFAAPLLFWLQTHIWQLFRLMGQFESHSRFAPWKYIFFLNFLIINTIKINNHDMVYFEGYISGFLVLLFC